MVSSEKLDCVALFLKTNLCFVAQKRRLRSGWLGVEVIIQLVGRASGIFTWTATACRFIKEGGRFAPTRLEAILRRNGRPTPVAPAKHLYDIYAMVPKNHFI